jgi:tRNA pseudouridine38-40 synthase
VRVRLQVAYDGRRFHGFAAQPVGVRTVAGVLAGALERVLRTPVPPVLTCAGRTDAGVHAWDQWVHVDLPAAALSSASGSGPGGGPGFGAPGFGAPGVGAGSAAGVGAGSGPGDLQRRLVKLLGPEVVVRSVSIAPPGWHARHSALSRTYRYSVLTTSEPDPFRAGFVWWVPAELDRRAMDLACDALIGEHDFATFCRRAERGDGSAPSLVRTVTCAGWSEPEPGLLRFEVTANAFCQQMVRSLVGTLVEVGRGKRRAGDMLGLVRARDRGVAGAVAPPDGLVLWRVRYPAEEPTGEGAGPRVPGPPDFISRS